MLWHRGESDCGGRRVAVRGGTSGLASAVLRLEAPEAAVSRRRSSAADSGVREFVLNDNVSAAENVSRTFRCPSTRSSCG